MLLLQRGLQLVGILAAEADSLVRTRGSGRGLVQCALRRIDCGLELVLVGLVEDLAFFTFFRLELVEGSLCLVKRALLLRRRCVGVDRRLIILCISQLPQSCNKS